MKTYTIVLLSFIIATQIVAQSNGLGVISGGIGANIGAHAISLEKAGISITPYGELETGIISTNYPMELNIGIAKPLSVGFNYTPSRLYLAEDGDGFSAIKTKSFGVNFNVYMINRNRFNMQFSLTPGILKFDPFELRYDLNYVKLDLEGKSLAARLMFNIYLSKNAGLYLNLGYSSYQINVKQFVLHLEDPQFEAELNTILANDLSFRLPGLQAGLGVVFKLN